MVSLFLLFSSSWLLTCLGQKEGIKFKILLNVIQHGTFSFVRTAKKNALKQDLNIKTCGVFFCCNPLTLRCVSHRPRKCSIARDSQQVRGCRKKKQKHSTVFIYFFSENLRKIPLSTLRSSTDRCGKSWPRIATPIDVCVCMRVYITSL